MLAESYNLTIQDIIQYGTKEEINYLTEGLAAGAISDFYKSGMQRKAGMALGDKLGGDEMFRKLGQLQAYKGRVLFNKIREIPGLAEKLKNYARDNGSEFNERTVDTLLKSFYDDMLKFR